MSHILAAIPTRSRYHTTLPLALQAVALQTRPPDEMLIIDDTDEPIDLRTIPLYGYLFQLLDSKKIKWRVQFGLRKGQHYSHQYSQDEAKDLIWRIDDDNAPEPNVLECLCRELADDKVGAAGGLVIPPPGERRENGSTSRLVDIGGFNVQWTFGLDRKIEAEHLYSTFLYRKGIAKYELELSRVAHREETLFTHSIHRAGYKLIITPKCVTWHYRYPDGGIRQEPDPALYQHDEEIFQKRLAEWGVKMEAPYLVYLDSGMGDHIVFKKFLPELKEKYGNIIIACCYPAVFPREKTISLADAKQFNVNPERHDIYKWMWDHNWTRPMLEAYREIYK